MKNLQSKRLTTPFDDAKVAQNLEYRNQKIGFNNNLTTKTFELD